MSEEVLDFLAREQDALADLNLSFREDEISSNPSELPQGQLNSQSNESSLNNVSSNPDLDLLNSNTNHALLNGDIHKSSSVPNNINGRNEEPEKMKKWREDQRKRIEEKDKAEEAKEEELRKLAKKQLQEWNSERKERLEQLKKNNREREVKHDGGDSTTDLDSKNSWTNIAKMIESYKVKSSVQKDRMKAMIMKRGGGIVAQSD